MCYSSMVRQDLKYLEQRFDAEILEEAFEEYYKLSAVDSKVFKPLNENPRIFPYYFAPVVAGVSGSNQIMPMRYQVWPRTFGADPKHLSLFNARRDNLTSPVWSQLIGRRHGILVIDAFYEWVAVKDVVAAGVVSIEEVRCEFARQSNERKKRIDAQGKKYRPTKTELIDPMFRSIIINFKVDQGRPVFAPVIWDEVKLPNGAAMRSFAIITDEPTPEIKKAGHDRRPINLTLEGAKSFLASRSNALAAINEIFDQCSDDYFVHGLENAS